MVFRQLPMCSSPTYLIKIGLVFRCVSICITNLLPHFLAHTQRLMPFFPLFSILCTSNVHIFIARRSLTVSSAGKGTRSPASSSASPSSSSVSLAAVSPAEISIQRKTAAATAADDGELHQDQLQ